MPIIGEFNCALEVVLGFHEVPEQAECLAQPTMDSETEPLNIDGCGSVLQPTESLLVQCDGADEIGQLTPCACAQFQAGE